ncbi:N-acetylneuraminate synthase [Cohnella hashimotonis]|uniref:N-acetylneuraminate synthase n=1 Tax=Cohnella hashimotonis TaxID=2826895 RepID=A0ABT6TU32_9BACL|nr:N-acetylneuraminate synthase [Cohnella hashimotonis]MDI4650368.1 N-acetylneuraminate synthase [Cohnella hashimotonis]
MATHAYLIAEAGVNHNGSLERALAMVDAAAEAGANAIKFQTFKSELVISKFAPKAEYQKKQTGEEESQLDMVRKLELDRAAHEQLIQRCEEKGIDFVSTPFDLDSVKLLGDELQIPVLKIPSGEITNAPLLLAAARTDKQILLSTGMSSLGDVETALGILAFGYLYREGEPSLRAFAAAYLSQEGQQVLQKRVRLFHCTTEYPAPYEDVNLNAINSMRSAFGLPVGLSDHTPGIEVPIAAVAMGAELIEKHFTMDRSLSGPDHAASLEPDELKAMVFAIRHVEAARGDGIKRPAASEIKNIAIARKSLVASKAIRQGEVFTERNLTAKRPGTGISPLHYWELLGKPASRDYEEDEVIRGDVGEL